MLKTTLLDEWPEDKPQNVGDYKLNFGKYIGQRLSDIPNGYLDWCLDQDFDKALLDKIRRHLSRQASYNSDELADEDEDEDDRKS